MTAPHETYQIVRAGLLLRGYSLAKWCDEQGVSATWVRKCLAGKSDGPAAQHMAEQVKLAAGCADLRSE
jgi:hypothetical protein